MSTNKNAIIRYQTLDKCFQNFGRRFYIEDLLEKCNEALLEFNHTSEGIKKRQLYSDIRFMESPQGWNIPLEKIKDGRRAYYRYASKEFSINKQPVNELEAEQLKSAILVLSRFKGLPQFEWVHELIPKLNQTFKLEEQEEYIVGFDTNDYLKGTEFISPLFNVIRHKQVLVVHYKSFRNKTEEEINFHPYHLKQYNNRWFVLGKNPKFNNLTNLALDRIIKIRPSSKIDYIENSIDFNDYFEDIIGVTKPTNKEITKIEIWANPSLAPYIKTKPLHGSQKRVADNENGFRFTIEVIPNYELEHLLLSYGEDLSVLSPVFLKNKLRERIQKQLENY